MGKVLSEFLNGKPGTISRSIDDIVEAWPNTGAGPLPFGVPVFKDANSKGVKAFSEFTTAPAAADFVGFSVRSASKTPDTYGSDTAAYAAGEMADILVRGAIVAEMVSNSPVFSQVYLRVSDGALTGYPGESGTTFPLPGVSVRGPRDRSGLTEIVVKERLA